MREEFEQMATGMIHTPLTESNFICVCVCVCVYGVELQTKHEKKMVAQREELELRRKTEIHEVEEVSESTFHPLSLSHMYIHMYIMCPQRKNGQINTLMKNHEKAFSDIKNYYNDITLNNLALINSLKVTNGGGRPCNYLC